MTNHYTIWRITWQLTKGRSGQNTSGKGGWIIQEFTAYLQDKKGNWHLAPGAKAHYYEAWLVSQNSTQTDAQYNIAKNLKMDYKPSVRWGNWANSDALAVLNLIARLGCTSYEREMAFDEAIAVQLAINNKTTTPYASADDRYGTEVEYWQNQVNQQQNKYTIMGVKFVGRAVFVQQSRSGETLKNTFNNQFVYNNLETGAGPLLQSMVWSKANQQQMDQFLQTHSHSAGIDHTLETTWKAGSNDTTVKMKGP